MSSAHDDRLPPGKDFETEAERTDLLLPKDASPGRSTSTSFDLQTGEEAPILRGVAISLGASMSEQDDTLATVVIRKLNRNLMVLFFVLTVLCYVDRTNLAFAALQLNRDLHFSHRIYGLGSGLFFFIGYVTFQVPSNLAIVQFGGRVWLGCLVVLWGLLAMAFACISSAGEFYVLRLALGAAESGTMPGMWYIMSLFYSEGELTLSWAWVLIGIALSQVLGGPMAAAFLSLDGVLGLRGWQILFLAEGAMAVLAGVTVFCVLADSPSKATFLSAEERTWLQERNARLSAAAIEAGSQQAASEAVADPRTWHLAAISLLANIPKYGIIFWCPLIIDALLGSAEGQTAGAPLVALLTGLPFGVSAAAIFLNSSHSKATGERHYHVALPLIVAAGALAALALLINRTPVGAFAALLLLAVVWAPDAVMASWPATFLQGPAAATGVALINSVGSVGGMIGPALIGFLADKPTGYFLPLMLLAGVAALVALLALLFPRDSRPKEHGSDASTPSETI